MAQGSLMLQIGVEQTFGSMVTDLPEVWAVALHGLDGNRTVVREIAGEKSHVMWLMASVNNYEPGDMSISDHALSDVWLVTGNARRPPTIMYAPSHVTSPPIDGAVMVLLRVRDFGVSVNAPGAIATIRRVSSHVYFDETISL
jgi:hypothetical protein